MVSKNGTYLVLPNVSRLDEAILLLECTKIRRLLVKLEQEHLIHSSNQFNRFYTDRSKWYRIDYEKVGELLQMKLPNQEELFPEKQSIPERKENKSIQ